jgi:hypothetical protein
MVRDTLLKLIEAPEPPCAAACLRTGAEIPRWVYSVGLLGAKTEIPVPSQASSPDRFAT